MKLPASILGYVITHYRDNGQTIAKVSWTGGTHTTGEIANHPCPCCNQRHPNAHLAELANRCIREGIPINTVIN
jgi:hypothetical protein